MADHLVPSAQPTLVGREREQAVLRDALSSALAGRGSLVLVGGEAGIGKTALAEATLVEAKTQGAVVLVGRCYDLTETPPYGPWAEALNHAPTGADLPDLPVAVLPPGRGGAALVGHDAIFRRVRDYFAALAAPPAAAGTRPVAVLLDDVHWADPASLDLLRVVGRDLAAMPVLLLATYRAEELTHGQLLYAFLPLLVREAGALRLDLHPLVARDLRALAGRYALPAADADQLAIYLAGRAEGNPFYTGEVLRTLEEAAVLVPGAEGWTLGDLARDFVPPLLRQVLDARLDRLGVSARDFLATAAVLGQEVPLDLWAEVQGVAEGAVLDVAERVVAARILDASPDGAGVRFHHALARAALYEGLGPLRRRGLHRRAAEALLARATPDVEAVAHHLRQAGDTRAAEWLVRAGFRAYYSAAWLTAAERLEAAVALLEAQGGPAGERGWLCIWLAQLRRHDNVQRALAYAERAGQLATEASDAALAAYALLHCGILRAWGVALRDGLADIAAAIAAQDALPPDEYARLAERRAAFGESPNASSRDRTWLIESLPLAGRYAEAAALAEPLVPQSPAVRRQGTVSPRFGLAQARAALGHPGEARRLFAEGRAAAEELGNFWAAGHLALVEIRLVQLPYYADDPAAGERLAEIGARAWVRAGGWGAEADGRLVRLPLLIPAGRWDEAWELAVAAYAGTGVLAPQMGSLLAPLALLRGDLDRARAVVAAVLHAGPSTAPGDARFGEATALQRVAASLALDAGDLPAARAWLEAHDRWLAWNGAMLGRAEGALGWAAYHRMAGDIAQARDHAERALTHASEPRQPLALLAAHRTLGELATAGGRFAEAMAHLEAALALADACAAPYERALCLLAVADLLAAERRVPEAGQVLADARAILEPLEARPTLARAEALAARLASPTPAALPFGLTAREAEVLRLVVAGLTNPQVADRLFVTPRTVNGHLTAVYTKLGVEGRAAAIRVALDHGLR